MIPALIIAALVIQKRQVLLQSIFGSLVLISGVSGMRLAYDNKLKLLGGDRYGRKGEQGPLKKKRLF